MENISNEINKNQSNDFWQAEVLGQIYDTNFAEMTQWITDGALMPTDKVRRNNLRWLEAGKVPTLLPFFNAKEHGIEPPQVQTNITDANIPPNENFAETENFHPTNEQFNPAQNFQSQSETVQKTETNFRTKFSNRNISRKFLLFASRMRRRNFTAKPASMLSVRNA